MQFNQKALDAKMEHLDEIKQHPNIIDAVIRRHIKEEYEIEERTHVWMEGVVPPT